MCGPPNLTAHHRSEASQLQRDVETFGIAVVEFEHAAAGEIGHVEQIERVLGNRRQRQGARDYQAE
jgi:hypothetical protein